MRQIIERPTLPAQRPTTYTGLAEAYGRLIQQLLAWCQQAAFRINRLLPLDGTETMTGPLTLSTGALVTDLPDATLWASSLAIVTTGDTSDPAGLYRSDGAAWTRVG